MRLVFSKKWLINLMLAGLAMFVGFRAYDAWSLRAEVPPDDTADVRNQAAPQVAVVSKERSAAAAYDLVVEKNLFAEEREEIIPEPPKSEQEKPPEKKPEEKPALTKAEQRAVSRLTLIGVVLSDDRKAALIQGVRGKGPRSGTQWVVEGDEIAGMRVAEIRDEKVLLLSGDAETEILLYDPDRPRKRAAPKKEAQPTVVSSGGPEVAAAAETPGKQPAAAAPKKQPVKTAPRVAPAKAPIKKSPMRRLP